MYNNNLGGKGPKEPLIGDPNSIEFLKVMNPFHSLESVPPKQRSLKVTNLSKYEPHNSARNGVKGDFGVINIKSGTEVLLRFDFFVGNPFPYNNVAKAPEPFLFSILDLDAGTDGGQEYVKVMGYNGYRMAANSAITAQPIDANNGYFYGSKPGSGSDNPEHLMTMTQTQMERVVTFEFPSTTGFDILVGATPGRGGRNIFFGGPSSLYCDQIVPPHPWGGDYHY